MEWNVNKQKRWPPARGKNIIARSSRLSSLAQSGLHNELQFTGVNGYRPNKNSPTLVSSLGLGAQHKQIFSCQIPVKKYTNWANRFCTKPIIFTLVEQVWTSSNGFNGSLLPLKLGPDHRSSSALSLNFEPDFSQVLKSSGPNHGSELDWGISTTDFEEMTKYLHKALETWWIKE